MREIKFKCLYDNRIYHVVDIDFAYQKINLRGADIIDFKDGTLLQYTGLKDKNGVEIYEGDIVKEDGYYGNGSIFPVFKKIQWKENYSCWLRGEYERLTPKNIKKYNIEVIGNIYDNPGLLEEE